MRRVSNLLSKFGRFSVAEGVSVQQVSPAVTQLCYLQHSPLFSTCSRVQQFNDEDDDDYSMNRNRGGGGGGGGGMGRGRPQREITMEFDDVQEGTTYPGRVVGITSFGAFVDIGCGVDGLVHISQIANEYVREVRDFVDIGQDVQVKCLGKDNERNKLSFSMKLDDMGGGSRMGGRSEGMGGMGGGRSRGSRFDDEDDQPQRSSRSDFDDDDDDTPQRSSRRDFDDDEDDDMGDRKQDNRKRNNFDD